mgnify:FL=1
MSNKDARSCVHANLTSGFAHRQLKKPSLSNELGPIYFQKPPQIEEQTRPNLIKRLDEIFQDGDAVTVTDASLPLQLDLVIKYSK